MNDHKSSPCHYVTFELYMLKKMKTVLAFNFSDVVFIMLMNVLKNANKIQ